MEIITRAEWGARRARPRATVAASSRSGFMVHYSTGEELGRPDTAEWVREIQAFHMDGREWADIGYNFLVDAAGRIFEGRGWDYAGAHCTGYNASDWGVCFLGDDDPGQDAPEVARQAIRALHDEAVRRAGHPLTRRGHRDGKATACPGDELLAWVHAGMPVDGAPAPAGPRRPTSPVPGPTGLGAPTFPLPAGHYFGPRTGPAQSISGLVARAGITRTAPDGRPYSPDLQRWQQRLADRTWTITPDGRYGPQTARVAGAFQAEKGLAVDELIGRQTWAAAWNAPIS